MNKPISRITYCQNISLITLPEVHGDSSVIAAILTAIAQDGVNVDMISQTAPLGGSVSMSFSVSEAALPTLLATLNRLKSQYPGMRCEVSPGMNKINFYDAAMVNTPGVAAMVLDALSSAGVEVMMITTSTVDISILVSDTAMFEVLSVCRGKLDIKPEEVPFE